MTSQFYNIPSDIFRDNILPYTYRSQSNDLLKDIRSFHDTNLRIRKLYAEKFPTEYSTTNSYDTDKAWLSNDISRFLNNDRPLMYGFVNFYKEVYQRLYMNRYSHSPNIPDLVGDDNFTDIKVSIGLLLPSERKQLEIFLGVYSEIE